MSVITMFTGDFCLEEPVIKEVLDLIEYKRMTDDALVMKAVEKSDLSESKIRNAFTEKTSVFNRFTHEKERALAYLKLVTAEALTRDKLMLTGYCGMLIPMDISHVLRICLIADLKFRIFQAMKDRGLSEKDAFNHIKKHDRDRSAWINTLYNQQDPWDASLYDIVIPIDKIPLQGIGALIKENIAKDVVKLTKQSEQAVADFQLGAEVGVALAEQGHDTRVSVSGGDVLLTIHKQVLMLNRLEDELKSIVEKIPGVNSVTTRVGSDYYQADVYRKYDFEVPSKVLLVDDEREFVHTLSERLQMRDMGSAVAYDGQSALDLVREDDPEVMILDLKMPGIDGIEVLRQVKETRPEIEVIILTGHGSDEDRKTCMKLGAFAYLQKPVDIEILSETLKSANEKIKEKKK